MSEFDNYKFRCSSLGKLMSSTTGKSYQEQYDEILAKRKAVRIRLEGYSDKALKAKEKDQIAFDKYTEQLNDLEPKKHLIELSETAKTHLCDIYTSVHDGRNEDIKSKYMEKGLHIEEDAITLYCRHTGQFAVKNTEEKENAWIKGSKDFSTKQKKIVDTKVNWSIFQFNRLVGKPVNPVYIWQGKGYMWLWDEDEFDLAYCLLNTPEHLLLIEEKRLLYDFVGTSEDFQEACKELRYNHTYDDKPVEERVRIFNFQRDRDDEEKIKLYVEAGRNFLNNFGK